MVRVIEFYRVIQTSLCTCQNTNIFLMVNLRLQHGITNERKVVVKVIQSRDTHKSRVPRGACVCTGTFESQTTSKTCSCRCKRAFELSYT
jgi:hypothetical protein